MVMPYAVCVCIPCVVYASTCPTLSTSSTRRMRLVHTYVCMYLFRGHGAYVHLHASTCRTPSAECMYPDDASAYAYVALLSLDDASAYAYVALLSLDDASAYAYVALLSLDDASAYAYVALPSLDGYVGVCRVHHACRVCIICALLYV
jgi:hypothetical protein